MAARYEPNVSTVKAAFGLQCFWHSEACLASAPGVIRTRVGYAGGTLDNPTGDHIETIEIDYDPKTIKYEELLERFWLAHDPTVKHKRQYTSAIFYYTDEQKCKAEKSLADEQKNRREKIVTEILSIGQFYNAEDYHQKYLLRCEKPLYESLALTDAELISSHVAAKLNAYVAGYGDVAAFEIESKNWDLNDHQQKLAKEAIASKGGKPQGCGT